MLADNYFKLRSPDILCKDESFNTYIEVMRLTESESTYMVIAFLRRLLSNLPYRVNAKLKYELSLPARDFSTRKKQVSLVRTSLAQFNESFKKEDFSKNGLLYGQRAEIASPIEKYKEWKEKEWKSIINDKENKIPKWIFLSEPKMKNVSGVMFRKYNKVFYFPNPFACDEINYPVLNII